MLIPKHTEDYRQELLDLGKRSLYLFCKVHLGMRDLDESLHLPLCEFLEGRPPKNEPWRRAMVCGFRGSLKSSLATIGYPWWRALYIPGFSAKIIEGAEDLARENHFDQWFYSLLTTGPKAAFLSWLYSHRIPEDYAGFNKGQIQLLSPMPGAPTFTYGGLNTTTEGYHGDLIIGDDLEGADAQESEERNERSWRKVAQLTPLLRDPRTGQILIVGTPWGLNPLVWRIRNFEGDDGGSGTLDNSKRKVWKVYWRPILGDDGKSVWPARFPDEILPTLRFDKEVFDTQFLLQRRSEKSQVFDMRAVEAGFWRWIVPGKLIGYPAYKENAKLNDFERDDKGIPIVEIRKVDPGFLRYYIHVDPKHKAGKQKHSPDDRPSRAAIAVVGVNHDSHAFIMDAWCSETAGLEELADEIYKRYRLYAPYKVTMEPTGAQNWFWAFGRELERGRYKTLISMGRWGAPPRRLPRLTSVLEESAKGSKNKEAWIISQLSSWFDLGLIHASADQTHLRTELEAFPALSTPVDLLDALSHGPPIWSPPISDESRMDFKRRQQLLVLSADDKTGYVSPWGPM